MPFTAQLGINLSDLDNIEPGLGAVVQNDPPPDAEPPPDPPPGPPPVLQPNPPGVSSRFGRRGQGVGNTAILEKYGLL